MQRITQKTITAIRATGNVRFIRDSSLIGFGIKVSAKGRISFIVEGRVRGDRTRRITLGQSPALNVTDARQTAADTLALMQRGIDPVAKRKAEQFKIQVLSKTVGQAISDYMKARTLKPKTAQDYHNTFNLIFSANVNL